MSLTSTLANAVSGLKVAQAALATTANNVANVNTPGYSRKTLHQESRVLAGQGAGVRSLEVGRIADPFIAGQAREQAIRLGRSDVLAAVHERIQDTIFGAPGDLSRGIANQLTGLSTALDNLAATPEQAAARMAVTGRIDEALRTLDADMAAVQAIRQDIDRQIGQEVGAINADLAELAATNAQFTRGQGSAELQDRRDRLLRDLAGKIDIQIGWHDDGRVDITTGNGTVLLDGQPRLLLYEPASSVAMDASFGKIAAYRERDMDPATGRPLPGARFEELASAGTRAVLTPELAAAGADPIRSHLRGGSLQGLIEARDRVLPELADQLDELASLLRHTLNAAHNEGAPHPPPPVLTGTRAGQSPGDPFIGTGLATLALVDRTSGQTVTAFQLDLAASGSIGDVMAAVATGSAGALVASLDAEGRLVLVAADPAHGIALAEGDSAIEVTDPAGHERRQGLSHFFGLNDLIVDAGKGRAGTLRADIARDGFQLASARLDVRAGPPLVATLGGQGDARGAAALALSLRTPIPAIARGALPAYAATPLGYAADIASLAAATAAQALRAQDGDRALADDLENRIGSRSGVNLDEEMSRLILYQQAYSVSARIIAITDELFGVLLQIAR